MTEKTPVIEIIREDNTEFLKSELLIAKEEIFKLKNFIKEEIDKLNSVDNMKYNKINYDVFDSISNINKKISTLNEKYNKKLVNDEKNRRSFDSKILTVNKNIGSELQEKFIQLTDVCDLISTTTDNKLSELTNDIELKLSDTNNTITESQKILHEEISNGLKELLENLSTKIIETNDDLLDTENIFTEHINNVNISIDKNNKAYESSANNLKELLKETESKLSEFKGEHKEFVNSTLQYIKTLENNHSILTLDFQNKIAEKLNTNEFNDFIKENKKKYKEIGKEFKDIKETFSNISKNILDKLSLTTESSLNSNQIQDLIVQLLEEKFNQKLENEIEIVIEKNTDKIKKIKKEISIINEKIGNDIESSVSDIKNEFEKQIKDIQDKLVYLEKEAINKDELEQIVKDNPELFRGPIGEKPKHQVKNGWIWFENPDGSWGTPIKLKGNDTPPIYGGGSGGIGGGAVGGSLDKYYLTKLFDVDSTGSNVDKVFLTYSTTAGRYVFTYKINDSGTSTTDLWTASKIIEEIGNVPIDDYQLLSEKNQANGYAGLINGKIDPEQLPDSVIEYKGSWNANTNIPSLVDGTGNDGDFYVTSVAGTHTFGGVSISFTIGDWVMYRGGIWKKDQNTDLSGYVKTVSTTDTTNYIPLYSDGSGTEIKKSPWQINSDGELVLATTTPIHIGHNCTTSELGTIAIGFDAKATGVYADAKGYDALASGFSSIAHGFFTVASGSSSVAIGDEAVAGGDFPTYAGTVAVGATAYAKGNESVALGRFPIGFYDGSVALGAWTRAEGENSVAIGYNTTNNRPNSFMVGGDIISSDFNNEEINVIGKTYGAELLQNPDLSSLTGWEIDGDWSWDGNNFIYTHNTGMGYINQNISLKSDTWYKIEISGSHIDNIFDVFEMGIETTTASEYDIIAWSLERTNTKTVLFKTKTNPTNFSIFAGSFGEASGVILTVNSISLKECLEGNIKATGTITANNIYTTNLNLRGGVVSLPTIIDYVDGGDVYARLGDGVYSAYSDEFYANPITQYTVLGADYLLTDNSINYIIFRPDTVPQISVTTDRNNPLINQSNVIPIFTIYREGEDLYIMNWDELGKGLVNKLSDRIIRTERFALESGLVITTNPSMNVIVSDGYMWYGATRKYLKDFTSATDTCYFWYHSGGNWTKQAVTTYNNTQYDNGTNLVTLSNSNRYAVNYIYRAVIDDAIVGGTGTAEHICIILGNGDYKYEEALTSTAPTDIPPPFISLGVLVGRIIVQKSTTNTTIQSAFVEEFGYTSIDHNDMPGLQGGDEILDEFYHLTSAQHSNMVTNAGISVDNAIARFDLATGKIIQNSTIIVNDDGSLQFDDNIKILGDLTGQLGDPNIVIGRNSDITAGLTNIAIGNNVTCGNVTGSGANVAVGNNATAGGTISLGVIPETFDSQSCGVAIGCTSTSYTQNSIAIGKNSYAGGLDISRTPYTPLDNAIAIGYGTRAEASNSVAIGTNCINDIPNTVKLGYDTWIEGEGNSFYINFNDEAGNNKESRQYYNKFYVEDLENSYNSSLFSDSLLFYNTSGSSAKDLFIEFYAEAGTTPDYMVGLASDEYFKICQYNNFSSGVSGFSMNGSEEFGIGIAPETGVKLKVAGEVEIIGSGLTLDSTELLTIGTGTLTHDGTEFVANDDINLGANDIQATEFRMGANAVMKFNAITNSIDFIIN